MALQQNAPAEDTEPVAMNVVEEFEAGNRQNPPSLRLSDGEIHFLWWFIQGSIMTSSVRESLWKGWGMCERHTWGFLAVEAAFRQGYMHGPAILYEDLMHHAAGVFDGKRVFKGLREKGPCHMCELGYGAHSKGAARPELLRTGRDLKEIRAVAKKASPYWHGAVCGRCAESDSWVRCRRHLIEDLSAGRIKDLSMHEQLVKYVARHISIYALSFRYEYNGTETEEDAAALISAAGWCSGWKVFLEILHEPQMAAK